MSQIPQLDLPPISFARYLDLLRRRRWMVVPVSLLGLIVGGLFAFFVPRYYVATTVVHFNAPVLDQKGGTAEDPLQGQVASARIMIPSMVGDTLQALGWPEARAEDLEERTAFEQAVKGRVNVEDVSGPTRGRSFVDLLIAYRDTDRRRAEEFVTTLRETWLAREIQTLVGKHETAMREIARQLGHAVLARDRAADEVRLHEEQHAISPEDFAGGKNGELSTRTQQRDRYQQRVEELKGEEAVLDQRFRRLKLQLETTDPTVSELSVAQMDPQVQAILLQAQQTLFMLEAKLLAITEAHPEYAMTKRTIDEWQARVDLAKGKLRSASTTDVTNPEFDRLRKELVTCGDELVRVRQQLADAEPRLAAIQQQLAALPQQYADYRRKRDALEQAQGEVTRLEAERQSLADRTAQLTYDKPYTVPQPTTVPPRPTEPNITVVALAGSIVGLAIAIVGILLFDMLRQTFKTVDDVHRGLPVPVLGSLSHMETVEQRTEQTKRRLRASVIGAVFVVLVLAVVTIYYLAPTSLPPAVLRVLDVLLGGTR